jgi:hypothetical protein
VARRPGTAGSGFGRSPNGCGGGRRLDPGAEQAVQLVQIGGPAAGVQLDQELLADGAEGPLDLAAALWLAGLGVGQADAEHGQAALELARDERRAVVDIQRAGQAAGGEPGPERGLQPEGVLGQRPAVADQRAGVVVDGGEQVGLAASHGRAVQRISGPQLVGRLGLEPAEGAQRAPLGGQLAVQPDAAEMPLQGALVWALAVTLGDDDGDLRGGAAGLLPLERHRQLQRTRVDAGPADPWVGQQRVEPPSAPRRQAAIQRSRVLRLTRTRSPVGPRWSRSASAPTSVPRWWAPSAGSAASRIRE